MTGGPRGTAPPLDLKAVEARLRQKIRHRSDEVLTIGCDTARDLVALLAHTRALTARLESSTHVLDAIAELAGDSATRELAALNRDRNRTVLAAAVDHA